MAVNKKAILKWVTLSLWIAIGAGTLVLLVAASHKKEARLCSGINIEIKGVSNNFFVDKKDILNAIKTYVDGEATGQPVFSFDLRAMEKELQKNIWVKSAQLYFDNNDVLKVNVLEREPVARIFTTTGGTFYIDDSTDMLPLSEKFSARLPVFTGFPSDKKVLSKQDSALLKDILTISLAIQKDPFRMAMIDQVDITTSRTFVMVPKLGDNTIVFGDATDVEEKFNKLKLFYKSVMVKAGWDHYSVVNVQYKNQVVAKRKGAEDVSADSLRTKEIMEQIAEIAEKRASDSLQTIAQDNEHNTTDVNFIQQSFQRDDAAESSNTIEKPQPQGLPFIEKPMAPVTTPAVKTNPAVVKKTMVTKPVATKPTAAKPVTKPATVNKPVAKPATMPAAKPAVKPAATPVKPKATMPKTVPAKPATKPLNDY